MSFLNRGSRNQPICLPSRCYTQKTPSRLPGSVSDSSFLSSLEILEAPEPPLYLSPTKNNLKECYLKQTQKSTEIFKMCRLLNDVIYPELVEGEPLF